MNKEQTLRDAVETFVQQVPDRCDRVLWRGQYLHLPMTRPALAQQPADQVERWCPDVCPITGLEFFMWIEHHKTGQMVPTYGGPFDSYTIPIKDKDGSYCRERYDHDLGGWRVDEVEDVGIQIVSDQAYVSEDPPPAQAQVASEFIKKKAKSFAVEFGHDDDGSLSFGHGESAQTKMDHYQFLLELADEVAAIASQQENQK